MNYYRKNGYSPQQVPDTARPSKGARSGQSGLDLSNVELWIKYAGKLEETIDLLNQENERLKAEIQRLNDYIEDKDNRINHPLKCNFYEIQKKALIKPIEEEEEKEILDELKKLSKDDLEIDETATIKIKENKK